MTKDMSYEAVMARSNEIMLGAMGLDYNDYQITELTFDYDKLMASPGYTMDQMMEIQQATKVGNTPIYELTNITKAVREYAGPGKGATILVKDEAANASGSFKARRASISCYEAEKRGYEGVATATSGNYGAGVASQAAMRNLKCIVLQEMFDSRGVGQPEIIEKSRACEAYGAEVQRLSVGPELFYQMLMTLEDTGFFNASLYTPFAIRGVETLGYELANQVKDRYGKFPEAVIATNAGGGNLTGTARGLLEAGATDTQVLACSVDLSGLHMASDKDFNRKSFTTGHTGFGVPFTTWPDRTDVPKNAARPLRYMDDYVLVTQGEVFYVTELLSKMEGLERGPAGNTSLTGAIARAAQMNDDEIIVIQETEYTGAGKHQNRQLGFARENGVEVRVGDPKDNVPGKVIVLPERMDQIKGVSSNMDRLRRSLVKNAMKRVSRDKWTEVDYDFVAAEIKSDVAKVNELADDIDAKGK